MRILFIGDVVGAPGREMIDEYVPKLKKKYGPTLTIINGENAAAGRGITEKIYRRFLEVGAQAVTLGNHAWDNKDLFSFIDGAKYLVRPGNFPEGAPGTGMIFVNCNGTEVAIINLQGRTFLPPLECPFKQADAYIEEAKKRTNIIFIDFHAEATSEKQALGWYVDGRVTAVVGTHTHVPTADKRILPNGTAYITDVGMTGPYDGILGMSRDAVLKKFLTGLPVRFEVTEGRKQLSAVYIDVNPATGKAHKVEQILINDDQSIFE
ncbi:TIGR00282 family metallophosphoesterase [Ectobacillus sp. JY-23]|uniref:TIGR00282 family metallophosphoesterase n=1 Tax=Ectobacillus sp. JY-23 TaxID=2933872 RepID=UPI001FF3CC0C|nr:TIGR00282 family metallophosphoesterase [Ectobacillus sp. JY-23]UOY93602.1 TIGR00282 family metallophosphoesterase [Ectobacillus sp. JY-23]